MRSWPRWKQVALAALVSPTVVLTIASVAFYVNLHRRASAMSSVDLPAYLLDDTRRLLILAPHCDDETLGAGGLISEARRRNIPVSIAFFTNGDGYPAACALSNKKVNLQSTDYIKLGERRQTEAIAAAIRLGVDAKEVYFLSYPDRGLKSLWEANWISSKLYRSSYTAANHSPFSNSVTPKTAYCGESVKRDLVHLLEKVQPTDVFVTHPADDHADHSAAAAFAQAAVEQVRVEAKATAPQLHYYIVHRGDWPLPQGFHPDKPLLPPAGLAHADTIWRSFSLPERAVRDKTAALNLYHSQMEITGHQLRSFVRSNEIFGTLPEPILQPGVVSTVRDAVGDDVVRYANPSTDLTGLSVTPRATSLEIRVSLRSGATPGVRYALRLRTDQGVYLARPVKAPRLPQPNKTELLCRIPLTDLESVPGQLPKELWISAETGVTSRYIVDQTGYRAFHLKPETKSTE